MVDFLISAAVSILFALFAAWVARRVLGSRIAYVRATVIALIVVWMAMPVAQLALADADLWQSSTVVVFMVVALGIGWMLAVIVLAVLGVELLWPSGGGFHPIRAVRDAIRRRERLRRYAQILRIASKHGLDLYGRRRRGDAQPVPEAVVAAMNEAGVTFVKIGQVLSTRDDILPREFTDAFATLQTRTTPMPWAEARAAIQAELPRPIDEVFAEIEPEPLGSASVAQVHAAKLVTGEAVVIKIQRPEARETVQTDVDIISRLADDAERHTSWGRAYGIRALAAEFVRALREELDYRVEVSNTELIRGTLARAHERDGVRIVAPDVYRDLCTQRMIVQERIEGTPLSGVHEALPAELPDSSPEAAHRIAGALLDSVFEQIAVRGIFHADLHPGNIILRPDGSVALIDFGSIGVIERSLRRSLLSMLIAMQAEDDIVLTDLLLMLVAPPADGSEIDRARLQHEIGVILTKINNGPTDAGVFRDIIAVLRGHQLAVPPALVLVFRTIGSLEGSLRHLDADFAIVAESLQRAPRFIAVGFDPRQSLVDGYARLQVVGEQLRRLPRRLESIGQKLETGTFTMRVAGLQDAAERSWLAGLVGQVTTAFVGVVLIAVATVLIVTGGGPALTASLSLYPFAGAVVGLAGLMLVLRALRQALDRRT